LSIFSQYHLNFIKTLIDNGVKFLLIGGQAAIYYGVRRGTGDLDLLIEPTQQNGQKILNAFNQLNLQVEEIQPEEFEQPLFLGLGFEPDAVDILTITPGVDFNSAYQKANEIHDTDVKIKVISIEDLIKIKESLIRNEEKGLIDKYDVAVLKKIIKGNPTS
jgi:predicted nucleotidyltransferase